MKTLVIRRTAAFLGCAVACMTSIAQAAPLNFVVDSTVSYVQLAIPNFSYSGNDIDLRGVNRTNGAPLGTANSWGTTSGNQSFFGGTFSANVGGNLSGQTLTAVQFIGGANSLAAIASGNYRPNPAAYNALVSGAAGGGVYNNNIPAAADFSMTAHVILGNAALSTFYGITYDATSNYLAGSGTVGTGSVLTNDPLNPLNFGVSGGGIAIQGLSIILVGQIIPNALLEGDGLGILANLAGGATYNYTGGGTNLNLTIPLQIPISIDIGGGVFINGTAAGRLVANAAVPEPSTLALAGLGFAAVVMIRRRRRPAGE